MTNKAMFLMAPGVVELCDIELPETPSRRAPNRVGEKMLRKASEF